MTTLAEIQTDLQDHLGVDVADSEILLAYNDFSTLVWRAEGDKYPESQRKTSESISVPSSGYDLSLITDLRNARVGFEVYGWDSNQQRLTVAKKYSRAHPAMAEDYKFYVDEGYLKIPAIEGTNQTRTVKVLYFKKRNVIATGSDLSLVNFEYDQDLEYAFRKYARMMYFDGRYQPDMMLQAEQYALGQIEGYFSSSLTI